MPRDTESETRLFRNVLQQAETLASERRDEMRFQDRVEILASLTGQPRSRIEALLRQEERHAVADTDDFFSVPFQLKLAGGLLAAAAAPIAAVALIL